MNCKKNLLLYLTLIFGIFSFHTGLAEIWALLRNLHVITLECNHHTVIYPLCNIYFIVISQISLPSLSLPQFLVLLTVCAQFLTVSDSLWPPWTVAHHAPLPMEFSRQGYCSRMSFPTPGDRPDPGIELLSLTSLALAGGFFVTSI